MNDRQQSAPHPAPGNGSHLEGPGMLDASDSHPALPALSNLVLVLFLWVAGTGLAVFLGQELVNKGYFSSSAQESIPKETLPDSQELKVAKLLATGAAALLVFPAQMLLLVAMMRHPGTGCPLKGSQGNGPSHLKVLVVALAAVIASHGMWMVLGACLNRFFSQGPQAHPLSTLLLQGGGWGLVLVTLQGCLVAPVMEETLCRGYLMTLLATFKASTNLVAGMVVSMLLAGFAMDASKFQGNFGSFNSLLLATLLFLPGAVVWMVRIHDPNRLAVWSAIVAQAQIFSCLHASSWPAPVALIPLALGLGWMRASGQSLLACMVVHGLFNLVSMLLARFFTQA